MSGHGVVAAGHSLTAEAAAGILREGGNAFDAILAAHFMACVAEPVLCSLGGGGFLLAAPVSGGTTVFDFFAQTPRRCRPEDELDFRPILADFGTAQQEFHIGLGSIATPGSAKGAFAVHRALGSMPMRDLVVPAVEAARSGMSINALQGYIFSIVAPIYTASPEASDLFAGASGATLGEGERYTNPEFADLLEVLAIEGEDLFYRGEVAEAIDRQCREGGGHLTRDDLGAYEVEIRRPLRVDYGGVRIHTNPPPASGGILIAFALELLKAADLSGHAFGSPERLALLAQVMGLTNRARLEAGLDRATADEEMARLLDPALLARYRAEVAGRTPVTRGTTHISVMDARGNVAAMTVSNGEGCGGIVPGTGMMLNNMLGEEDLNPRGFHRWTPDERMTSMMSPTLVEWTDGRRVALGSGGSNRIRTAILQVLGNLVDRGMGLEEAVASPRIHLEGGRLSIEGGFDRERLAPLLARHPEHELWGDLNLFFGGVHAVEQSPDGSLHGMGDPRRGGCAFVV